MNSPSINLALAGDAKYFIGLETTLASAIVASHRNTKVFNVYLDCEGITENQKTLLESLCTNLEQKYSVEVNIHWLEVLPSISQKTAPLKSSRMFYTRVLLPELVPDQDWILWIDSDIVVRKDLSSINTYLNDDTPLACVIDHSIPTIADEEPDPSIFNTRNLDLDTPYFNTGFMPINLKLWREAKISEQLFTWLYAHNKHSRYHDQSAINWCLADQMKALPEDYNSMATKGTLDVEDFDKPVNLHFAGTLNPWQVEIDWSLKFIHRDLRMFFSCFEFYRIRTEIMGRCDTELLKKFLLIAHEVRDLLSSRRSRISCYVKAFHHKTLGKKHRFEKWKGRCDFYRDEAPVLLERVDNTISQIEKFIERCSATS